MTAKRRKQYIICSILSFLAFFGPIIAYTVIGLCGSGALVQKFTLCSSLLIVCIMSVVAALNRVVLRSRIWIILLALFICLDHFLVPLIVVAATQILDQLVFGPLKRKYKRLLQTNKEIDAR